MGPASLAFDKENDFHSIRSLSLKVDDAAKHMQAYLP
jgi:hypothetical protein